MSVYSIEKLGVSSLVGDRLGTTGLALPKFNLSKWDDSYFVDVNHSKSSGIPIKDVSQSDGKLDLLCGDILHRYYEVGSGLEYEMWFQSPPKPEISFKLTFTSGLTFHKQLALSEQEISEGCVRPENIINSYAVYAPVRNNQYQTGK